MKRKQSPRLCCLGGGKMGEALIRGLLASRTYQRAQVMVVEPDRGRREFLKKTYGIQVLTRPVDAEVLLLAVKPQDMPQALDEIMPHLRGRPLIVSIAAGISTDWILERIGDGSKLVRAMPNAAAVVGQGATGLYFCPRLAEKERSTALRIFDAVGLTVVVDKEDQLNMITGLSGSGPAYVFLFLEALTDAGVTLGLSRDTASKLALQTVFGSACMARETDKPIPLLKEVVTSPGGTTVAGLKVLEEDAFRAALIKAVEAATHRARELAL